MKSSHIARAALLLPLLLSGCVHKQKTAQNQPPLAPPIEDAPPTKPNNAPTNLPPPVITVPAPTQPATANTQPPPPPPKPRPHRKPKPADTDQNTQIASNNAPPAVSAVGNLSTGEPADLRKQTDDTISQTERGLNGISRTLNDQEKKTSAQIREFLKQARAAMTTGDVDGAHTLAQKAKVLLGELTTQ
jgi:type IV secretory pathway VirB10-like protein